MNALRHRDLVECAIFIRDLNHTEISQSRHDQERQIFEGLFKIERGRKDVARFGQKTEPLPRFASARAAVRENRPPSA